jgi:hypothetical protein
MTTALVATVPTDVGNLSWQADHLALEADDGGTQWLVSIATKERRQLPRPSDTGYWDLEFEDGLGKLTFLKYADDGSSGDDPPCEWAQDYLEWAAYRLGEDVTVKHSRSGMQYDLRRYLCLHEPYDVGIPFAGNSDATLLRFFYQRNHFPCSKVWVSLAAVGQHLHWGRLHARQDQVSQIIGDRWKTWCRLLDALDLPGGIRKPRAIGDNRVPDPTRPFEDPTASLTALLVILFREA